MFHPCQLEKKFGGEAESPSNYWPPYVGPEFYPDGDKSHLNMIDKDEYARVIRQNTQLDVHPEFITDSQTSRDFRVGEPSKLTVDLDDIGEEEESVMLPNPSQDVADVSHYSQSAKSASQMERADDQGETKPNKRDLI